MKGAILTVGTEILIGSILNSNSKYLSEKLTELGVHVSYHISVRDSYDELKFQILTTLKEVDILFLCGGLGPTKDDMTKETLSEIINKDIILDKNEYLKLKKKYEKLNLEVSPNNRKQVEVIEGAKVLSNLWGAAPGEVIEFNNKKIVLLPGPPKEFCPMVDTYLKDIVFENKNIIIKSLNIGFLGESKVEEIIRKLNLEDEEVSVNTFAKFYDTEIKIIAEGEDLIQLKQKVNKIINILKKEFNGYMYSEDNIKPNVVLVNRLKSLGLTISFAESVTGGLIASKITEVPGSSNVLKNSIVCYSNDSKKNLLGISDETLRKYGAVSSQTAIDMAKGLKKFNLSDINVSTTGEAGPIPSEKEVGEIFVCYNYKDEYKVKKYNFYGNRNEIQERVANTVILDLLFKFGGNNG